MDKPTLYEAVVKQVNGQSIKIRDMATVQIGAADKIGDGSLNASPAVILTISKQPDVNTLDLSERLDEAIAELGQTLPKSVEIKSQVFRQSDFIDASTRNLKVSSKPPNYYCLPLS